MTPVLKYPGAKWRTADWIISYFPAHKVYCEPFFGSGAVFFNKDTADKETINDKDKDVCNFFTMIRERGDELADLIDLTPYSRDEYYQSYTPADNADELERARLFAVKCHMSYGGSALYKNGFRTGIAPTAPNPARIWNRLPEAIRSASNRLKSAQIENLPAEEIIYKYNNPETLIYADPPYLLETRKGKRCYKNEMSESEHESLLHALKDSKSKVIISGYNSGLYNDLLKNWVKVSKQTTCEQGLPRTECLWLNFEQPNTFFDLQGVML